MKINAIMLRNAIAVKCIIIKQWKVEKISNTNTLVLFWF